MALKGLRPEVLSMDPYEPGKTIEEVRRELGLERIIKLGSNENSYAPFPEALEAMRGEMKNANRYPDIAFEEIKGLLADIHGVAPENIAISHGAEGMLQAMGKCFIEKGDEVLLPSATYGLYREISKLMGARIVDVPLKDFTVDLEKAAEAVTERTKLIWLCNPNNPTGILRPRTELLDKLDQIKRHDALLFCDEAFIGLSDPRESLAGTQDPALFVLHSLTKTFSVPGLRIGFGFGDPDLVEKIETFRCPWSVNALAEAFAMEALLHLDELEKSRDAIARERDRLVSAISSLGLISTPSAVNYLLVDCGRIATPLCEALAGNNSLVRDCNSFGLPTSIRIAVRNHDENSHLLEALASCVR